MASPLHRALDKVRLPYRSRRFRAALDIQPRADLVGIADPTYGGYVVPASLLREDSVVFLCGTGTDITFDLELISRFGCRVLAMDPVPAAAEYVAQAAADEPRHEFLPYALWNEDTELTFHAPRVEGYISHSATDMHGTEVAFTATARRLATLAAERGVGHVDLLKISAEGSEYTILDDVLASGIPVTIIAVEFATPVKPAVPLAHVEKLTSAGYQLVAAHTADYNWKLTFVRT
ncbi:FkbM family methyltransferase [Conexibacter sp. W3-3-2]|uniref:FkbM family methyltransferase n=1 Tax=Conexibacter sp. W3-3-2 TaxID=2675227 RepID=UPI0012B93F20|nr:FkbM family methyltransferase [Conexibacter sp. W3-3-2]MTD47549.1 FkbM family methyltransferase [Conexibacter sp. W3-3-2]